MPPRARDQKCMTLMMRQSSQSAVGQRSVVAPQVVVNASALAPQVVVDAGAGTHADDVSVGASSRASASPGASSGSHPDPYCSSSCSKPSARLYAIYASV